MTEKAAVFEETYNDYLSRIAGIDLPAAAAPLGAAMEDGRAVIPLLNRTYRVSKEGIAREDGKRPQMGTCVILSKYLLLCPPVEPSNIAWASYRDFKDSGPLAVYWANEVEGALVGAFAGRTADLEKAAEKLGGYAPDEDFPYDVCYCFDALPKISMLLLFNDVDDEFPAKCTILFQARAEKHLDGECLAMLGAQLAGRLVLMLGDSSE
ncbi:MAG: DUF3786 domain-containing protein [Desulfobacterales bacterium]|nr:DUF3786 domain-containing protein [Desulfobacterales bacterium]